MSFVRPSETCARRRPARSETHLRVARKGRPALGRDGAPQPLESMHRAERHATSTPAASAWNSSSSRLREERERAQVAHLALATDFCSAEATANPRRPRRSYSRIPTWDGRNEPPHHLLRVVEEAHLAGAEPL